MDLKYLHLILTDRINLIANLRNTNEIVKQKEYNEEKSSLSPRPRLSTIDEGFLFLV